MITDQKTKISKFTGEVRKWKWNVQLYSIRSNFREFYLTVNLSSTSNIYSFATFG